MLRRTAFKQLRFERVRSVPVPIVECRGVIHRVSDEVVAAPKAVILRSRPYRMYCAQQECFFCGIEKLSQAAHENLGKPLQGKVCDSRIFPACIAHGTHLGHHFMFDNYIDISREEAREVGARFSARMRLRAMAAGWRFTPEGIVAP